MRLHRGTCFLVDGERDHYSAKDLTLVHVAGATRNAKLPSAHLVTVDKHNQLPSPAAVHRQSWLKLRLTIPAVHSSTGSDEDILKNRVKLLTVR